MRSPVDLDDIEAFETGDPSEQEHRDAAATLLAWAEEPHPDDTASPALLLVSAAFHLQHAGDDAGALDLMRRAVDAAGDVAPDARVYLHESLVRNGLVDEARELAGQVRRSRPSDPATYLLLGESYEGVGDLAEANRWLTLGLARAQRTEAEADSAETGPSAAYMLGIARARVRHELGFPPDEDDLAAAEQMAALRERWAQDDS